MKLTIKTDLAYFYPTERTLLGWRIAFHVWPVTGKRRAGLFFPKLFHSKNFTLYCSCAIQAKRAKTGVGFAQNPLGHGHE